MSARPARTVPPDVGRDGASPPPAPSPPAVPALRLVGDEPGSASDRAGGVSVGPQVELALRIRVAADEGRSEYRTLDVVVDVSPAHTVAELTAALCAPLGIDPRVVAITAVRTGRRLRPDRVVGEIGLVSGDELEIGPSSVAGSCHVGDRPARAAWGVAVDIVSGPDSGRSVLLGPGRYGLGRRAEADVRIHDPSVSRDHAIVTVHGLDSAPRDWVVVIDPAPGAANGVTVNDIEVHRPTTLAATDVVALGATRLAFRPVRVESDEPGLGRIDFHRTPYRPPIVAVGATDAIGPIPTRPEPRRLQIFAVLAPLAAGLLMYTFTRQVQFLALTLISPVVMVATVIEDRRTGRRRFRRDLSDFRAALPEHHARLDALRHAERIDRFRASPDVAELVRRAELRTIDLWARGRAAPDFLALRVGLGPATVRFAIELEQGGDDDLRAEALAAVEGVDRLASVPVVVDLCADRVVGVQGHDDLVDGVAASLLIQAATLHSPEDLIIAGAVAPERPLGWMKWLPHLRSVASPLPGNHLATTRADADALIARLIEVASFRTTSDRDTPRSWPRVLVVLDHGLDPDPAEVSRLLDAVPDAGISVIWLAPTAAGIPRHATRVLDVRLGAGAELVGWLWSTDPDVAGCDLEVEHVRGAVADRAARALAPVRDGSTASLATSIPRTAPLFDVLDVGHPTAAWVTERWHHGGGYHLRFPVGIGVDGPLELDLVHDGPHTLIGGTSGAGKSELLQSIVAALAVRYPPTRLNFLFVDYKGGASSQVFERLPHTVGYVTNLGAALSLRALTSLRAELNRRMALMEGCAKDLPEMLDRFPGEAPPSLVIVVDEFATLVKEVPEFVAGIIDIAQRGRSLGIHLVLATQRPSGSVNENILANTNLRISLRMLDRTESSSVIGSPEAADIPVPLRGRALARLGPRRLVEFQSAFAGAPLTGTDTRQPVLVVPFVHTDDSPRTVSGPSADRDGATQLDVLIDAVAAAAAELDLPPPRRPWRDVLPDIVVLDQLAGRSDGCDVVCDDGDDDRDVATDPARFVTIGLLDAPELQEQRSALIDLEDGGGLLVFGAGGSGKTTLLRTVAASINANADEGGSAMLVFDFASRGLTGLRALPDVIDVATGDDLEAVTRHLAVLDAELRRRRRLLADAGAEHLTAFRREHGGSLARIVVLIDGFGGMVSTLMESSAGGLGGGAADEWVDRVQRLVVEGRQVGIHTVITADRRNAVPSRIHAAVSNRLILRHADEGSYAEHGIGSDRARQLALGPGRGLLHGTTVVQVASVSNDPSARAQVHAIERLAASIDRGPTSVLRSVPLPDHIDLASSGTAAPGPLRASIGPTDVTGEIADVDLAWSHIAVCGPPRSGRSTALATVIAGLQKRHDVAVVGLSTSPLATLDLTAATFGRPSELAPTLDVLANRIATSDATRPPVLVVDDADALDDPVLAPLWDRLTGFDHLRLVISLETRAMAGYTTSALVTTARRARRLLVLQPDDPGEFLQTTGLKLPTRPGLRYPAGRGVLLVDRIPQIVQVGVTSCARHNS